MASEWKAPASYDFLFSPDLLTPPQRGRSVQRVWFLVPGWFLSSYLLSTPPGGGRAGVPFIFGVPLHDGNGPALREQELLLFQPAALVKEEGETPGSSSGREQAQLSWGAQASFLHYPISWRSGPAGSPGARYCGKLCALLF